MLPRMRNAANRQIRKKLGADRAFRQLAHHVNDGGYCIADGASANPPPYLCAIDYEMFRDGGDPGIIRVLFRSALEQTGLEVQQELCRLSRRRCTFA